MIWDVLSAILRGLSTAGIVIVGLVCGVLCLLLFLWFVRVVFARWKRLRRLNIDWPHAEGRLIEGLRGEAIASAGLVTYEFEANGATHTGADDAAALRRHRRGAPLDIVYDPENPGMNNLIAHGAYGRAVVWLIACVVLAIVTAAAAALGFALAVDAIV